MITGKTNRRKFVLGAAATAGVLASPAIIRPAFAQSNVVNVWTYANFLPTEFKIQFERDTGIHVQERLVDDQGKQFNLLAAEQPAPTVDIITVAGHRFNQFVNSGLIEAVDIDALKHWQAINPAYSGADWLKVNGDLYGVPLLAGAEILAYNTDMVTPEEASTWAVMFDEKFKGQTAYTLQDMMSITMLFLGYDPTMVAYMDDPAEAKRIVEEVRDFLITHKPWVRNYYDGGAEVQQMFINQDIAVALAWSGPISALIMEGAPVDMTVPEEGSIAFVYNFNVVANGPNRENAYTLLDAILGEPSVGTAMTRASGYLSTIRGADAGLDERERRATTFSDEELSRLTFFNTAADELKYPLVDPAVEQIKAA